MLILIYSDVIFFLSAYINSILHQSIFKPRIVTMRWSRSDTIAQSGYVVHVTPPSDLSCLQGTLFGDLVECIEVAFCIPAASGLAYQVSDSVHRCDQFAVKVYVVLVAGEAVLRAWCCTGSVWRWGQDGALHVALISRVDKVSATRMVSTLFLANHRIWDTGEPLDLGSSKEHALIAVYALVEDYEVNLIECGQLHDLHP